MAFETERVRRVIAEIDAAFAAAPIPGDDRLLHPMCLDDGDIVDFYGLPDVHSFGDAAIIRNYAAPSFFSAEAFRYYMPAFMRWSLAHPDSVEIVVESTLRAFDPGPIEDRQCRFQLSKFALLTPAECRAVAGFLEVFVDDRDLGPIAEAALRNHWYAAA